MTPHRFSPCRACLTVFLLLGCAGHRLVADEIVWRTDYARALQEAQKHARPLLVDVGTEDCHWCKQLDQRTFKDAELIKLLNERCIPLKIDGNRNSYLVKALRVQSYPTLVFAGPDGAILGYKEGFMEAAALKQMLMRVLTAVGTPDWMKRDLEAALKAIAKADHAQAVTLLRNVVEDGKSRPVQVKARVLLEGLEKKADEVAQKARELAGNGKVSEAIAAYNQLGKEFPGTLAARHGGQMLMKLAGKSAGSEDQRKRQAGELLEQAREDYKNQRFLICLDRCERLSGDFADLAEARDASKLAEQIKNNPDWTRKACDQLGERLGVLYLALADSWLKKGQPQQAIFYLQRIVKMFPGSRHAEMAQVRLARLRGSPARTTEERN